MGRCLRMVFAIGEWQDKIYYLMLQSMWGMAEGYASRLYSAEQELMKWCGIDTSKAMQIVLRLQEALKKKNKDEALNLLDLHNAEILRAIERAQI